MRNKHTILMILFGVSIILIVAWIMKLKMESQLVSPSEKNVTDNNASTNYTMDPPTEQFIQDTVEQENMNHEIVQENSKYEENLPDIEVDLTYLDGIFSRGKQFILKRQIQAAAQNTTNVTCLEYQGNDSENMQMEFFFLCDNGEVLKAYYSYSTLETSIERTELTENDVWSMMEEEKIALEQAEKAKIKAEQKAQAEAEKKAREEAEKAQEEAMRTGGGEADE